MTGHRSPCNARSDHSRRTSTCSAAWLSEPRCPLGLRPSRSCPASIPLSGEQGSDVRGCHRLASDTPLAAADILDRYPSHRSHALALDGDHCIGESRNELLLLVGGEDILDRLYFN